MGTISCYLQRGYRGQSLLGKGVYFYFIFLQGERFLKVEVGVGKRSFLIHTTPND